MPLAMLIPPNNPTLFVALAFLVVLIVAILVFKRGNVFGEFRFFGLRGKVDASTPADVKLKRASADGNITLQAGTNRRVEGEELKAKGDIKAISGYPQRKSPKK
jgi:hypothetical protein